MSCLENNKLEENALEKFEENFEMSEDFKEYVLSHFNHYDWDAIRTNEERGMQNALMRIFEYYLEDDYEGFLFIIQKGTPEQIIYYMENIPK